MRAVFIALFAAMIGCASVQPVSAADAVLFSEKVRYSFCAQANCVDGSQPVAGLIDVKGTLYGTTVTGGSTGNGTVFAFDRRTGAETVLYSFCQQQNCADGALPQASLIDVKGMLYGTTTSGGTNDSGTLFAVDRRTGAEKVLHSFGTAGDGVKPVAGLIDVNGKLYGTTTSGGTYANGTVFAVDRKTGAEKVLYSFCPQQNCADGATPLASLIDVNGILYGTTNGGGAGCNNIGCGTVFALDPGTGAETVLYSFCQQQKCADGQWPVAGLIDVNGILYGTTFAGGISGCSGDACGVVFSLDPNTGAEMVIHSFSGTDGRYPEANLIDVNGMLYGTTLEDGAHNNGGTVFALDPNTGTEKVLHSFCGQQNCTDGAVSYAGLIDVNGKLFGTTEEGGAYGDGTVFAIGMP